MPRITIFTTLNRFRKGRTQFHYRLDQSVQVEQVSYFTSWSVTSSRNEYSAMTDFDLGPLVLRQKE